MALPANMRCAVWYGGDDVRLEERSVPEPAGDGVRPVRVLHAPARGASHVVGKVVEPLV